jgi:hypothetical protein
MIDRAKNVRALDIFVVASEAAAPPFTAIDAIGAMSSITKCKCGDGGNLQRRHRKNGYMTQPVEHVVY